MAIRNILMIGDDILTKKCKVVKEMTEKNKELEQKILKLKQENDEIIDINETVDEMLLRLDNFKKFFDYTEDFEEKKNMIKNLIKFIIWNSDTRKLELVLIGSDKERPLPYYLPLSKVNRGNGTCRNNSHNGTSAYGKRFNKRT